LKKEVWGLKYDVLHIQAFLEVLHHRFHEGQERTSLEHHRREGNTENNRVRGRAARSEREGQHSCSSNKAEGDEVEGESSKQAGTGPHLFDLHGNSLLQQVFRDLKATCRGSTSSSSSTTTTTTTTAITTAATTAATTATGKG
jgi:hypothetical protein